MAVTSEEAKYFTIKPSDLPEVFQKPYPIPHQNEQSLYPFTNNYNGYNTKCYENKNIYIHIYKINLKNNIRTRELSQHISVAYLKWDSPI